MNYGKLNNGIIELFKPHHGGLILGNKLVINPSEEQYMKAGWYPIEYINEAGESKIEDNKLKIYTGREYIRSIDDAKHQKQIQIDSYDSSPAVNSFYYGEQKLWIDKATRVGLVNAVNSEIALGAETITFGIQGISVTLPCQRALQMLYALERYALKCYNTTLAHKNAVDNLTTIEEVDNYNYIEGYPEKLRFEV